MGSRAEVQREPVSSCRWGGGRGAGRARLLICSALRGDLGSFVVKFAARFVLQVAENEEKKKKWRPACECAALLTGPVCHAAQHMSTQALGKRRVQMQEIYTLATLKRVYQ